MHVGVYSKQYKREPITIRIDFEKLNNIDMLAASFDISRSEFINQCIDYALAHIHEFEKKHDALLGNKQRKLKKAKQKLR